MKATARLRLARSQATRIFREIQLYIDQYNREQMAIETMTDFEQRQVAKVQKANKNLLTE